MNTSNDTLILLLAISSTDILYFIRSQQNTSNRNGHYRNILIQFSFFLPTNVTEIDHYRSITCSMNFTDRGEIQDSCVHCSQTSSWVTRIFLIVKWTDGSDNDSTSSDHPNLGTSKLSIRWYSIKIDLSNKISVQINVSFDIFFANLKSDLEITEKWNKS